MSHSKLTAAVIAVTLAAGTGCQTEDHKVSAVSADPNGDSSLIVIPVDSPKLKQLRVETVRSMEIPTDQVVSPGKIEVNPNRVSRVVLPVAGRIASVGVRLGDSVQQGQVLLTTESPEADAAESAHLQAAAQVTQARAAAIKSQNDFERTSDLYQHNAVARKEVVNAENAQVQARAAVEQAEALREQSVRRLALLGLKPGSFGQKIELKAPLAGKVLEMNVAAGEYRNDTNAPLVTIADLSTVWVAADVPESYIRFVQIGERVDITLAAYPNESFRGRVAKIASTVDPQTRTIKVRAEMDNPHGRFRPEMFGSVRHTESTRVAPVLPSGAVVQGEGRSAVFVEQAPGRFKKTDVVVGKPYNDLVPIESGVAAGDRVVVDGAMLLQAP